MKLLLILAARRAYHYQPGRAYEVSRVMPRPDVLPGTAGLSRTLGPTVCSLSHLFLLMLCRTSMTVSVCPCTAVGLYCVLVLSCTILCSTAFCRLSNDSQRRITQRIDIDGAAYRLHGQKLAFSREWNDVGETASAAAAGNRLHSGMVRATNDPWSCAVTAPMARNLK